MKTYLVTLLVASMGYEKLVTEVILANSAEEANRTAMLNEAHHVDESNFDEVLASNNGDYLEDGGHGYRIKNNTLLRQIEVPIKDKSVPFLIPETTAGFYTAENFKHLEGTGEQPYLVSLKWLADADEKTLEVIQWATSSRDAMINALVGEVADCEDEDDMEEKYQEIFDNDGTQVEDDSGVYSIRSVQRLTLIDFEVDGGKYAGLVNMSATLGTIPTLIYCR